MAMTANQHKSSITQGRKTPHRRGSILSAEMLIVFPVMMVLLMGVVETSLMLSTFNQLKLASSVGARVASVTPGNAELAVAEAVEQVLAEADFVEVVDVSCDDSGQTGGICRVTVRIPMSEAAPDLLGVFGFTLDGTLEASTAMRKE